jgi:hypothetical protein
MICDFWLPGVWLTRIALLEEMYTRICEENGPADPALKVVSDMASLLANLEDLDKERSSGLQWLLITYAPTYVTVILLNIGRKAVN